MLAWLQGKKTYILVVLGFLAALVGFLTGDMSFAQFVQSPEFIALLGLLGVGTVGAKVERKSK